MVKKSKRIKEIEKLVDITKNYQPNDAIQLLKACPAVKFDQSIEVSINLNVDPKKQQVRGTASLPHGTGKKMTVVVIARGEKLAEALEAGADFVGGDDLVEKIKGGWTEFSTLIVTPDWMREIGKLGKVLGPRGLMPSPKAGTVTNDVAKKVKEVKAGEIEFKLDKSGVINTLFGKLSFSSDALAENLQTLLSAIVQNKPPGVKGSFFKSLVLSSTMGPGLRIDLQSVNIG